MAIGDGQFEHNAKPEDQSSQRAGEALLADSQPALPAKPTDNQATVADATTPVTDTTVAIGDKFSENVTANLPASLQAKIGSLCSNAEGTRLLNQEHPCGLNVMQQLEQLYPLAYRHAGLDRSYNS
jgi:hypothetical protein